MPHKDKEKRLAYSKAWNKANKEKVNANRKKWKESNPDYYKVYNKHYHELNKEKRNSQSSAWSKNNPEWVTAYSKDYYKANREKIIAKKAAYAKNKKQTDTSYKMICSLRTRQNSVLKGNLSTTEGLGCTSQQLIEYLSSKFTEGMSMSNHGREEGKWTMDHKIPLSSAEKDINGEWKKNSEYNKKLIHYTNIQPMWYKSNLRKQNKIDQKDLQEFLERVI